MTALSRNFLMVMLTAWSAIVSTPAMAFDEAVMASVVSVLPVWTDRKQPLSNKPGAPKAPEGSGIAVFADGYIATNHHVLGNATEVYIRLANQKVLPAEIIGRDVATDIALLKINMDLPVLAPGAVPPRGVKVCSIGNQFGLGLSIGCGVVSTFPVAHAGFNPIEDFIQTDATVNPGGSGGALITEEGALIGMVSAIFTTQSDGHIGVNFATSNRLLYRIVDDLKAYGRVRRTAPGLQVGPLSNAERASKTGARIIRLFDDSAAAKAGLRTNDIITAINGRDIFRPEDVTAALALLKPLATAEIEFNRKDSPQTTKMILPPFQAR